MIDSGYARAACTCARSALATPDTTPALQCPALPPPAPSIAARPRRSSLRRSSRWAALVKLGRAECIAHFTKGAARRSIRGRLWRGRKLSAMLSAGRVHRCLLGTSGHLSDSKPRLN